MIVGHLGTFGAPLNVRQFFSKFDSEYFSLFIFLKYLFLLLLIMIYVTKMTLLEKSKICRTFRAVGHLGTLQTTVCKICHLPDINIIMTTNCLGYSDVSSDQALYSITMLLRWSGLVVVCSVCQRLLCVMHYP